MSRTPATLAPRARRTVQPAELPRTNLPAVGGRPQSVRIHRPNARSVVLPLREDERYVFGRHDAADVVFDSPSVSRLHGVLRCDGGTWRYEDLGSRNGSVAHTAISGVQQLGAHQSVEMHAHDKVEVGSADDVLELLPDVPLDAPARSREESTEKSPAARAFAEKVELAARTKVPVFLLGPSGCGKTHTARQIHVRSHSPGPFVPINCARLPQDASALHSELLGHVKGAFTGAELPRVGKLTHANGGTLFLDEVESLSNLAQGFLLDVLEGSGDLAPLGAREMGTRPPLFRLISASKVPLLQSGLRPDLCERLAEGHMWRMPTLAERREDIAGLVRFFAAEQSKLLGVPVEIADDAVALSELAPWPGQIRQVRAMLVALSQMALAAPAGPGPRKLSLRKSDVERHLQEREEAFGSMGTAAPAAPKERVFDAVKPAPEAGGMRVKADARSLTSDQVRRALDTTRGNQSEAARHLGIARNTLARRMRDFGIPSSEGAQDEG